MKMIASACAPRARSIAAAAATAASSTAVRMVPSASVRSSTSSRRSRSAMGDELAPQAPGLRPVATAHFQHVAKAARRDHADAGARAAQAARWCRPSCRARSSRSFRFCPARASLAESPPPRRRGSTAPWRRGKRARPRRSRNRSVNVPPTSTPTMVFCRLARSCTRPAAQLRGGCRVNAAVLASATP